MNSIDTQKNKRIRIAAIAVAATLALTGGLVLASLSGERGTVRPKAESGDGAAATVREAVVDANPLVPNSPHPSASASAPEVGHAQGTPSPNSGGNAGQDAAGPDKGAQAGTKSTDVGPAQAEQPAAGGTEGGLMDATLLPLAGTILSPKVAVVPPTTPPPGPQPATPVPSEAPVLLAPADKSSVDVHGVTDVWLKWSPVTAADHYQVEVAWVCGSVLSTSTPRDLNIVFGQSLHLNVRDSMCWRVRAAGISGAVGPWSEYRYIDLNGVRYAF